MRYGLVGMALVIVLCAQPARSASAGPRVVVSIKPLHSLVAGVMKGVGAPGLLMRGAAPRRIRFRSNHRTPECWRGRAVIFWVGEVLAPGLKRPLEVLPKKAEVLALAEIKGLELRKLREGGLWEGHEIRHHGDENREEARKEAMGDHHEDKNKDEKHHDKEKAEAKGHHGEEDHGGFDAHIWLDPMNARKWVDAIAHELGVADPGNRKKYEANARNLKVRIEGLHKELKRMLAPVKGAPYIVFHDAYQYMEKRYGLNAIGSVTLSPEKKPGSARLVEIRKKIRGLKSICVFTEPQFQPRLVQIIMGGTGAGTGVLDSLGASVPAGENAYFTLMRAMAKSLRTCLSRK